MSLEPAIRKNISFTYYEAGHMMYIEKKSRAESTFREWKQTKARTIL
jgi:hypothetical protein